MHRKRKKAPTKKKSVVLRKKHSLTAEDNILPDPKEAFELGKAINMKTTSKASKLDYQIQQQSIGSSERASITPEVLDEPNDIFGSSSCSSLDSDNDSDNETEDISSDEEIKADQEKVDDRMKDAKNDESEKAEEEHADEEEKADDEQAGTNQAGDEEPVDDQAGSEQARNAQANVVVHESAVPNPSSKLEKKVEAMSKVDHADAIEESIQANVFNKVNNQLPKLLPKAVSNFIQPRLEIIVRDVLQKSLINIIKPSSSSNSVDSSTEYELKNILYDKMQKIRTFHTHEKHLDLYNALIGSIHLNDAIAKRKIDSTKVLKKIRHEDKDEDPLADSEKKRKRKKRKDYEPSKDKEQSGSSPKADQPVDVEEDAGNVADEQPQEDVVPKQDNQLINLVYVIVKRSSIELEYHLEQRYLAFFDQLDWVNPEGDRCPYDLSKPLPLQESQGYGARSKWLMTRVLNWESITGDPNVSYSADHKQILNHVMKSTQELIDFAWLAIKSDKQFLVLDIERDSCKEGVNSEFLPNLPGDEIVDLIIALRMFTRSPIIKKRVEDVQLGVKSYQKKLNITRLQTSCDGISFKEPDDTLKSVRDTLHDMLHNFVLGYNDAMPKRAWKDKDQTRTDEMVKNIDNLLVKRRIMRSLECYVGKRINETDYRLRSYALSLRSCQNIRVIFHSIHSGEENPSSANIKQALRKERRESTVFKRLGGRGRSASAHSDSRQESSRYTENYSKSEDSEGGHWKSKSRRKKFSIEEDDLSQPWVCAETDPEDPEDHLKIFQTAAKMERWAMPTWCHMFNSTLTGNAQKKCIRDPIVLHNIKQRDGESTEDFIQRYKSESGNCYSSTGLMEMHGNLGIQCTESQNPELVKDFYEKIQKTVDEMMQVATSFSSRKRPAQNQERKKSPQAWRHPEGNHRQNFKKGGGFRSQHKAEKRPDMFALLTKTPKEILALQKNGNLRDPTSNEQPG
ncbi:hypothetical protein Tco_1317473 [Tanacetum coccineum]